MKREQIKKIVTIFLLVITTHSCQIERDTPTRHSNYFCKSYTSLFIECDSLHIWCYGGLIVNKEDKTLFRTGDYNSSENVAIGINAQNPRRSQWGDHPTNIYYPVWGIGSTGYLMSNGDDPNDPYYLERQAGYDKFIEEIGDTAYNKEFTFWEVGKHIALIVFPLKEVIVTANKSFGRDLPTGTNLNSLFYISFDDVYASIKNDYKPIADSYKHTYDGRKTDPDRRPESIRLLELSEANLEDYPFVQADWDLILHEKPERSDTYTFHIKMTFTDGTVLEEDSTPFMIKGRD